MVGGPLRDHAAHLEVARPAVLEAFGGRCCRAASTARTPAERRGSPPASCRPPTLWRRWRSRAGSRGPEPSSPSPWRVRIPRRCRGRAATPGTSGCRRKPGRGPSRRSAARTPPRLVTASTMIRVSGDSSRTTAARSFKWLRTPVDVSLWVIAIASYGSAPVSAARTSSRVFGAPQSTDNAVASRPQAVLIFAQRLAERAAGQVQHPPVDQVADSGLHQRGGRAVLEQRVGLGEKQRAELAADRFDLGDEVLAAVPDQRHRHDLAELGRDLDRTGNEQGGVVGHGVGGGERVRYRRGRRGRCCPRRAGFRGPGR